MEVRLDLHDAPFGEFVDRLVRDSYQSRLRGHPWWKLTDACVLLVSPGTFLAFRGAFNYRPSDELLILSSDHPLVVHAQEAIIQKKLRAKELGHELYVDPPEFCRWALGEKWALGEDFGGFTLTFDHPLLQEHAAARKRRSRRQHPNREAHRLRGLEVKDAAVRAIAQRRDGFFTKKDGSLNVAKLASVIQSECIGLIREGENPSDRTLQRHLKELDKTGLLRETKPRPPDGSHLR